MSRRLGYIQWNGSSLSLGSWDPSLGFRDLGLGCGIQALLNTVGGTQGITGNTGLCRTLHRSSIACSGAAAFLP